MNEVRQNLIRIIVDLKEELQEQKLSLPAHSIRPHQLLIIEELENMLHKLEEKLRLLDSGKFTGEEK